MCPCICITIYIYIYIYIHVWRCDATDPCTRLGRRAAKLAHSAYLVCVYIYIYICIERERYIDR